MKELRRRSRGPAPEEVMLWDSFEAGEAEDRLPEKGDLIAIII